MKCKDCNKKIGTFRKAFFGKCKECYDKEQKRRLKEAEKERKIEKKKQKVEEGIERVREIIRDNSLRGDLRRTGGEAIWNIASQEWEQMSPTEIYHKKDKELKYVIKEPELIKKLIKNNYDFEKTCREIGDELEYKINIEKFKEKERKRKIREDAEKEFYGRVKSKRGNISLDKKESILRKFNNKCVVCGKDEGLHIHHKDNNPKNNQIDNFTVLCGVCHKKAHMRVR